MMRNYRRQPEAEHYYHFIEKKTGKKRHCFESVSIFQLIHHLKSASESKQSWMFTLYFCVARLALFTNLGCSKFNLKPRFGSKKKKTKWRRVDIFEPRFWGDFCRKLLNLIRIVDYVRLLKLIELGILIIDLFIS